MSLCELRRNTAAYCCRVRVINLSNQNKIIMEEMSITTFVARYNNGEFASHNLKLQCQVWYDWFCKDSSLLAKTMKLGKRVAQIAATHKFDANKCCMYFKNNCPAVGPLYDQFSIFEIETDRLLYVVQFLNRGSHGCEKAHCELYGIDNNFAEPIVNGSWREVKKFFNA